MTFNKIAGAVLGAGLFVMGLNIVADGIYHAEKPKEAAIAIEVAEASTSASSAAEKPVVSLASLMAAADPAKGEKNFKACKACHTANDGGKHGTGPALWGIVQRSIASVDGFGYSDSLKEKTAEAWTFENLDAFIKKPRSFASKTKMSYGGMKNDTKRADLLAYLRTLAATPADLPSE